MTNKLLQSSVFLCVPLWFKFRNPNTRGHLPTSDTMPAHDLEQTRMISKPEIGRGLRDLPFIALERRDDDLSLGLCLALEEGSRLPGTSSR